MLAMNIEFCNDLSADEIEVAVCRIEATIRSTHQDVTRIFIEAASVKDTEAATRDRVGDSSPLGN